MSNVSVEKPQITRTDPKKRNFGALRTGDSGKGPKKTGQKSSGPEKTGKNEIPPEENFGHPKITSGVRSCPVKTVEPPEKNRRNRQSHPRKSIGSDVPVKEPQFVTMDRVNGEVTERWSNHRDNKSGKSSRIENVPDKCENLTEVSYFSKENVADSISSDAEQDKLTQLLICPVTSEDFSEEIVPYPRKICKRRDSDTDSKFELRQRFSGSADQSV